MKNLGTSVTVPSHKNDVLQGMNEWCKVSVLVPVYNVEKYLRECLDSLVAQTLPEIEFICIDDGSTDSCGEMLDVYAAWDDRFRVIHKENSGYGASMNVGLRAARGEYIGIVEPDDFADPDMFRVLYKAAHEHRVDVVKSNYWEVMNGKSRFVEVLCDHAYGRVICPRKEEEKFFTEPPTIWSCIYRREFLREQDIWFNETAGASYQDTSFVFLTKAYADSFLLVKDGYLHYRIDNAASSIHSTGKIYSVIDEYDAIQRHFATHGVEEQKKLSELSADLLYLNFDSTERRIPLGWCPAFWAKGYPKLKAAQEQGVFHGDLGDSMEVWMMQRYLSHQEKKIFLEGVLSICRSSPSLYLFGAGRVASFLLSSFRRLGCNVAGLLVSRAEQNPDGIDGVPVYTLRVAPADREHDAVMIAVTPSKPEVQQKIFFALEDAGYRNVIVLTEELRQALSSF